MENLIQDEIVTKDDGIVNTETVLAGKKIIGLYFSGSYCPPCRKFTPVLEDAYSTLKMFHDDFEIIFVSSDKDEAKYDEYYAKMPWLSLPYAKRDLKGALCALYDVKTVPTLIFFNDKGDVIEREGRRFVEKYSEDPDKIVEILRSK